LDKQLLLEALEDRIQTAQDLVVDLEAAAAVQAVVVEQEQQGKVIMETGVLDLVVDMEDLGDLQAT
jgi:hypothetical protein